MKKRFVSMFLALVLVFSLVPAALPVSANTGGFTPVTGWDMMERLGVGINIGNTLQENPWVGYGMTWPAISPWQFEAFAMKGFDHVRIPITWEFRMDANGRINAEWFNTVQEIVDWALDAGLYVIINTHSESGTPDSLYQMIDTGRGAQANRMDEAKAWLTNVWTQIAERFRDYPEQLLFEPMNEPFRAVQGGWVTYWEHGVDRVDRVLADRVNQLNRHALDVIRSTGGNNARRVVALTIPGATINAVPYYEHPHHDPYTMLGFFFYPGSEDFVGYIQPALDEGIPIYIKETSPADPTGQGDGVDNPLQWVEHYFSLFADMGIPTAWWSINNTSPRALEQMLFDRATGEWVNPQFTNAVFAAYGRVQGQDFLRAQTWQTIYSLANDSAVQNLAAGATGGAVFATRYLNSTGGGTASIVARAGGGNAIQISGRTGIWQGIEILRAPLNMNLNANLYRLTVRGRVANAGQNALSIMQIAAPDAPWQELTHIDVSGNNPFTLTAILNNHALQIGGEYHPQQFNRGFRIQTRNWHLNLEGVSAYSDFIIDDIIIEREGATPTPPVTRLAGTYGVSINGVEHIFDPPPQNIGNRMMLPFRAIGEALGMTVRSLGGGVVSLTASGIEVTHVTGTEQITVNGAVQTFEGMASVVDGGRTLMSVRMIAAAIGADVTWDRATRTAVITTN